MRCVVTDIIPETADTQTFHLGTYFPYKSGQAISLLIDGDPKKRFYSISSSPTEKDHIAITIKAGDREKKVYDCVFTLKKGTSVEIAGPFGSFTPPETLEAADYFLAGRKGVTHFRACAKYMLATQP